MTLSWSLRRKLLYATVVFVLSLGAVTYIWFGFFAATPTCFDQKQNGAEVGIDCGGSCALVCQESAIAPVVLWARALQNGSTTYTAAAYIQNNNNETGARGVEYAFQLFDEKNRLVLEKKGVTNIPPVQTVPIVEQNITVNSRVVTRALFSFTSTPVWQRVQHGSVPQVRIVGQSLSANATRLDADLQNDTLEDIKNTSVVAVLFDSKGVARAAAKSLVPTLSKKATTHVVFTWSQSTPDIQRAEISILPAF